MLRSNMSVLRILVLKIIVLEVLPLEMYILRLLILEKKISYFEIVLSVVLLIIYATRFYCV